MATYRLSALAHDDLDDIWLYIARDDLGAADRLLDSIVQQLRLLAENPRMGRERRDIGPSLRSHSVGRYLLFHRPINGGIEVVRILHGARNIRAIFQRG
ncbi:type II toxin-antitoxin system RelE/ParE family toxin [bacterium AH-315-B06]|nr:type II toxin-antitoxin system RelE/ParE family toxin [bacterium AH-315-B06]